MCRKNRKSNLIKRLKYAFNKGQQLIRIRIIIYTQLCCFFVLSNDTFGQLCNFFPDFNLLHFAVRQLGTGV